MKIQSRRESLKRLGKYKSHQNTALLYDIGETGVHVAGAYLPETACPSDAQPWFALAFGMDNRRFLLTLDYKELMDLKSEIEDTMTHIRPRRVK